MTVTAPQTNSGWLKRLQASAPHSFRRRRADLYSIVGGLAVLVACMFVVRHGDVGNVEESVFRAVNRLPDGLKAPMWVFQLFGMLAIVALIAGLAAVLKRYRLGLALLLTIPLKLALEWWVVKALVERERPAFTVADAIIRDSNTNPLGFPSGHAVFAFAVAGLLAPYLGRSGKAVVYSLAVLNGIARVYLGAHNPLDIVAGAGLGVFIAAMINVAVGVPSRGEDVDAPV